MPRVVFTERFDWHVKPNVTIAYKAGHEYPVPQACADEAIAKGKARPVPSLPRGPVKVSPDASQ